MNESIRECVPRATNIGPNVSQSRINWWRVSVSGWCSTSLVAGGAVGDGEMGHLCGAQPAASHYCLTDWTLEIRTKVHPKVRNHKGRVAIRHYYANQTARPF